MMKFNFDIDVAIVIIFLTINLAVGLYYASGKTTLREYAVGDKKFSTGTLAATIIATCIGGGFFSGAITESYKQGLYFIIPALGEPLCLIIIGYFLIPRMAEFLNDLSVADAMGNLYGKAVRIISAISGIFVCIGIVALQFKVGASILGVFFDISGFYAVLLCAVIVTLYSAFGGIKAVTFTDIIQFFTFGTIIPIISLTIWGTLSDPDAIFLTLSENPLFDYKQVFDFSNTRFISTIFLLMFFLVPDFQPVFFQRVIMAKNILQGRKSFIIGGLICLIILLVISWVGILLLSSNPNIDPNNLLPYIISTYSYTGLKGLTAIGVMAIIMSSADSYINSAAVLFTNDILKPLEIKKIKLSDLTIACFFSFLVGIIGFFLAFKASSVLNLLLFVLSLYAPIVSAPLLLTIFGFRSTAKSVLIGMFAGSISVIVSNILDVSEYIITDLSMLVNLIFFIGFHYLFKQEGGWVGVKNPEPLEMIRYERKKNWNNFIRSIREFSLMKFFEVNCPKQDYIYTFFGLFSIISVFSSMYSMPKIIQQENKDLVILIYDSVLVYSSIFLTFPVWPNIFKHKRFILIAWNIGVPYILLFCPTLLIIMSNFGEFQLMVLMVNIILIAILFRWQIVILMMITIIFTSFGFYKWFIGVENIALNFGTLQFKIMYLLLLVSSVIIVFLKPKQNTEEISELIKAYHINTNKEKQLELIKLSQYRQEFIRKLDEQCIAVFRSTYNQIQSLENEIKDEKLIKIIERLKSGAEYLDQVIFEVTDLINIKLTNVDFKKFIYDLIDEYKKVHGYYNLEITTEFQIDIQEIEIDPALIKKIIGISFNYGIINSSANKISMIFEPSELEYKINNNSLRIRREGIKTSIIINNVKLEIEDIKKILNPTFDSINEINFSEVQRVVNTHYGQFDVILDDKQLKYIITIPLRLKEIRPKKMNLPDEYLEEVKEIDMLINQTNHKIVNDIAKKMIKAGIDSSLINKITNFSEEELEELKNNL